MRGHRRFHLRPHAPHAPHHTADTHVRPRALVCACGRPFRENAEDVMRMLNGAWRVSRLARASQRDHLRVSQRRPRPIRASLLSHSLSLSLSLPLSAAVPVVSFAPCALYLSHSASRPVQSPRRPPIYPAALPSAPPLSASAIRPTPPWRRRDDAPNKYTARPGR